MPAHEREPTADHLTTLALGEIELRGRMPWSSNGTYLVDVCTAEGTLAAVYKPHSGERPLWDFPEGLYLREAAAWVLSDALGWDVVPETIIRADAPLGRGSLQRFVPADFSQHYFTLMDDEANHEALRTMAAFDLVANNADRKSGHCLLAEDGHIWGIDNGLCFHVQSKLRTVIWEFSGQPVAEALRTDLAALAIDPPAALGDLLSEAEIDIMCRRAAAVARSGHYPDVDPDRRPYPWPLV